MSKHHSADEKLNHTQPARRLSKQALHTPDAQNRVSPAPPKQTNANNQYR